MKNLLVRHAKSSWEVPMQDKIVFNALRYADAHLVSFLQRIYPNSTVLGKY
jgi:hypothetical protein